jgi:AcrR family transcriptional regulator
MSPRARTDAEKAERRMQILSAALDAFEGSGGEPVATVADLARRAGLAKGTVYLYFSTKEEIFLALLEEQVHAWLARFESNLGPAPGAPHACDVFCQQACESPSLLRLASLANPILERNLDAAAASRFRRSLAGRFAEVGTRVGRTLHLADGEGASLLHRSFALLLGLWQLHEPAPAIRAVLAPEDLAALQAGFAGEASAAMRQLWAGLEPRAAISASI